MPNHLSVGPNMNHGSLSSSSGMQTMQMPPSMQSSSVGMYDHMQPSVNINGVNMSPKADQHQNQMLQSQHLNPLPPQNQFLQSRNTSSVSHFYRFPLENSITRSYDFGIVSSTNESKKKEHTKFIMNSFSVLIFEVNFPISIHLD